MKGSGGDNQVGLLVILQPKDLKVDYFSKDGGNRHTFTADGCAKVTHLSTGIQKTSCSERSMYKNKEIAISRLIQQLARIERCKLLTKNEA